jgi:hypothetical protein
VVGAVQEASRTPPSEVGAKVALTVVSAVIVITQLPKPLQPPVQPTKAEPAVDTAVSVTTIPLVMLAEQLAPQSIPAGLLVTVPLPVRVTVSV